MSAEIPTGYRLPLVQEGTWRLPEPTMDAILGDVADGVARDISDPETEIGAALYGAFVRFVDTDGAPLASGIVVTITVDRDTLQIEDITAGAI